MKIPFDEQKTLNYLIEEERMEFPVQNRLFGAASTIFSVEDLSGKYKKKVDSNKKSIMFTPLASQLFYGILGLFLTLILGIGTFNLKGKDDFKIFMYFILPWMALTFLHEVFSKKLNYRIVISESGISVANIFYNWTEICKIYIVRRPTRRNNWYLILVLDTELIDRYNISNLTGLCSTENKLSAYIVHYKNFT